MRLFHGLLYVFALLLGLGGLAAGGLVLVYSRDLEPKVEESLERAAKAAREAQGAAQAAHHDVDQAREVVPVLAAALDQMQKVVEQSGATLDRIAKSGAQLAEASEKMARDMRGLNSSLTKMLNPDMDLPGTANLIDQSARDGRAALVEVGKLVVLLKDAATRVGAMAATMTKLHASVAPAASLGAAEHRMERLAVLFEGDALLRGFRYSAWGIGGLLIFLGASVLVMAFAHLRAAREA